MKYFNEASPYDSLKGIPYNAGTGFSTVLANRGVGQESLIDILPKLDKVQQVKLDRSLNLAAADPNDKRYPHYKGLFINDANWKQKLIGVFLGKEKDRRLLEELIKVVHLGIRSHEIQGKDQGGGSRWNQAWIKVYQGWLKDLENRLKKETYEAKSRIEGRTAKGYNTSY